MLVLVGFFILTFIGGVFSGKPPPCDEASSTPGGHPGDQVYKAHADALGFASARKSYSFSDSDSQSFGHFSSKSSSVSSSSSSYTSVISGCGENKCKDPNAVYKECPNPCPLTCAEPNPKPCTKMCIKNGCECAPGFILSEINGRCIRPKDCPGNKCKDPNAVFKDCPNPCPLTCAEPNPKPCARMCLKDGCECAPGFILSEINGRCIRPKDCPGNKCKDPNAVFKDCPNPCPLTCAEPNPKPCARMCLKDGCECAPGFILSEINGRCIRPKDCPKPIRCPKHEHYVVNDQDCLKTCGNRLLPGRDTACACKPYTGCVCNAGFVRKYDNATGPCIPERKCPRIPTQCGVNEEPTSCRIICPPQTCDSIFSSYYCLPTECEPGCDCLNGYLRNDDYVCIPSDDCFLPDTTECGPNEVPTDCEIVCPPQSCESLYTTYMCAESNCTAGCNCIDGYLRNSDGICIPSEECSADPWGCGGDVNARHVECGTACPATCAEPDSDKPCILMCVIGCECLSGYLLTDIGGVCIKPEDCPGASPTCGANQTYVDCKVGCPTNYCPVDDSRAQVACSMPYPCPGGCACIPGHLFVSYDDRRCVLASECPEVECTRPNEVWDPNPSNCFLERCEDIGSVCDQAYPVPPRCVCKEGFYRNASDICVPACECPSQGCKGDLNATLKHCPTPCPRTCADPNAGSEGCIEICLPDGCECNPGYVWTEEGGVCIKPEDCPPDFGCNGDLNATHHDCPSACPPTCANRNANKGSSSSNQETFCPAVCLPSGCVCKPGYILTDIDGQCVKPEDCPGQGCNGDRNATFQECKSACPLTCADQDPYKPCLAICLPGGCECNPGYVLTAKGGQCIKPEDCPAEPQCNGDRNATFKECPSACQATCDKPDTSGPCIAMCMPDGCVCKQGYLLNKRGGKCIKPEDCPGGSPTCGANETYVYCKVGCPTDYCPVDDSLAIVACDPMYPCPGGCACDRGYLKHNYEDDRCILSSECPPVECTRPNEVWNSDPAPSCFPYERCENRNVPCDFPLPGPPRCVCIENHFRNQDDICVPESECPDTRCDSSRNETFKECPSACQATCDKPDSDGPCIDMCMPDGCVCKQGYLLTETGGQCISPQDCPGGSPKCGTNKTYVYCKVGCPTNYCPVDDSLDIIACDPMYPCPGGCACQGGYLMLNDIDDRCILSSECPPVKCTRPNEVWDPNAPGCLHETCDNRNIPCNFEYPGPPRCVCINGYFRDQDGICVPESKCPPECEDPNATFSNCPSACPATCCEPDSDKICITACGDPGCECNEGFILSKPGGICIRPSGCPGGSPHCENNMTYVSCKIDCPMKYCPQDENEIWIICDPVWPCPSGCVCKSGYLMHDTIDRTCILAADCPPVECTRPNEVWDPSPSSCNYEKCDEMYYVCSDTNPGRPKCVCKEGYYRDNDGVCIPAEECPCQIPDECKRTCAEPTPPNCVYNPPKVNMNGCDCKGGYLLSELGGECILIEDCQTGCSGDPNAITKQCPMPCPASCESPNAFPCKRKCEALGCECKSGYLRSNSNGKCILPDHCPGGNPCGKHAHFVDCRVECLNAYCPVDDNREILFCDPPGMCLPGCICNLNHKRKSYDDPRCIVSSDCPPVECTRPNEIWSSCPSACLAENCEDVDNQPTVCNTLVLNCEPRCICKKNHFRNSSGICIPAKKCPPKCEDPNATFSNCPSACPATCCEPDTDKICITACGDPGCECNEGFILSEPGGICIRPSECPGGSPHCDGNMTYVSCKIDCPMKYCPQDENEIWVICDPVWPCPSGCECKSGYLMHNTIDRTCILAADCPPVECTRPNEVWDPSHSSCNYERCDEMYYICSDTNPGRPKCVCKEGYYRDNDGVCIPAEECPKPKCGYNEVEVPCRQICPPENCEIAYTDYACTKESEICEPGCNCLPDHLRNGSGICIPNEECPYPSTPVCGINEIARDCRRICPPQTCMSKYALYRCIADIPCEPGCDCVPNYLRDDRGICIRSEECPGPCQIPDECKRTCAEPNPPNCDYNPPKVNMNGCDCKEGYILSELGGDCIKIEDCQTGCSGDPNAITKRCPKPCPSTCQAPNASPCKRMCEPIGCECKSGYLRSNSTGKCILPDKCPGGNPCGKSGRFVDCKVECPNDYCPVDDSHEILFCDPPGTCLSGCICNLNHKRKSYDDPRCIVSSDCPPVECTRPNEIWSSCPSACLAENCEDVHNQPTVCNTLVLNCEPRCICKKNHFRNSSGICVHAKKCPC